MPTRQLRRLRLCVALGATLLEPSFASAQSPTHLSLVDAVDLALKNYPAIRESQAREASARESVNVARTSYLPRLDLLWQGNRSTRNNVFGLLLPQSVIPPVSGPVLPGPSQPSVWSAGGGMLLSWEAVDFGRRAAGVELARAESTAASADQRAVALEVGARAAEAFLAVAAADATERAARANVDRLDTFAATVRALVDNQLRAGAEQSRAEAELAASRNRLIDAQRTAAVARVTLAEVLGLPPSTPLTIATDDLLAPPAARAEAMAFDAASHPEAAAATARIAAVEANDRVIQRSAMPRLDVQTAWSARGVSRDVNGLPAGTAFGFDVPNWAVGMQVTVPSMEIFRVRARRRVEAERHNEAQARHDLTVQALQAQEARARVAIDASYAIAANTPRQLQAARDGDAQARARYAAGLTNGLEVAEGQRLLAEAEAETAVANLAVWRALLADAVLRGDLKPFLNRTLTRPSIAAREE